jgi:hypothetical protein
MEELEKVRNELLNMATQGWNEYEFGEVSVPSLLDDIVGLANYITRRLDERQESKATTASRT